VYNRPEDEEKTLISSDFFSNLAELKVHVFGEMESVCALMGIVIFDILEFYLIVQRRTEGVKTVIVTEGND